MEKKKSQKRSAEMTLLVPVSSEERRTQLHAELITALRELLSSQRIDDAMLNVGEVDEFFGPIVIAVHRYRGISEPVAFNLERLILQQAAECKKWLERSVSQPPRTEEEIEAGIKRMLRRKRRARAQKGRKMRKRGRTR